MPTSVRHPIFARVYSRLRPVMDRGGAAEHRRRLLDGVSGRVLEVGAGDGGNFALYPAGVSGVLAVEPEAYLRVLAAVAALSAPVPVSVVGGLAERLPVGSGSVDVAVASLMLCSVGSPALALAELRRVLRPGGELRFFEHVAASTPLRVRVQTVADRTVWPRLFGGCHVGRDTVAAIRAAGFVVEDVTLFRFPDSRVWPSAPHALGRAHS